MTKKGLFRGVSLMLALLLLAMPMLDVPADAHGVLATDLFETQGFTAEAGTALEGSGRKGLRFTGTAPAVMTLRETVTGDFSTCFAAVCEKSQLQFVGKTASMTLCLSRSADALTVEMGDKKYRLTASAQDVLEIGASADEKTLTVMAGEERCTFATTDFCYIDYRVSYRVTENTDGRAEVCIYAVNDTNLSVPLVSNAVDTLYMDVTHDGVQGIQYVLPQPYAFNLVDGVSSEVSVQVEKDGKTVLPLQKWTNKLRFPTESAGTYLVTLRKGTVKKEYKIEVRKQVQESEILVCEEFPFDTVGVGSVITLPYVTYRNDLYADAPQNTQFVVYRDNVAISTGVAWARGATYTFAEAGEYRFDYYSTEEYLSDRYSFCVTVTNDLPAIEYRRDTVSCVVGDTFRLPSVKMTCDGETLEAQSVLYFPSGQAVSNDVALTEGGIYTLEFRAEKDGALYRYKTEFLVEAEIHKTENSAVYGAWTEGYFDQPVNGLLVELTDGQSYEYGNIIDLSDNRDAYASLMKFYVLPYTQGVADYTGLQITLTDAYDESNYVLIDFIQGGGVGDAYIRCRASNQSDLIGLEWWRDDYIKIHKNNPYGYYGLVSFTGDQNINYPGSYSKMQFDLCFDSSTLTLYGTHAWHSSGTVGLSREMTRLADPDLYKEVFGGFTTGEVRLSVKAYNFNSSKGRILITDIDGQDLSQATVSDTTPPVLQVDTEGYSQEQLPQAIVGQPYPVFTGSAFDAQCGRVATEVKAFFQSNGRRYDVSITDGAFVPDQAGTYVLQYAAWDHYGNKAVQELIVEAGARVPVVVSWVDAQTSADTGRYVPVATWKCGGGHGFVQMTELSVQDPSGQTLEITNGMFHPEKAGNYTVCGQFEDYLGQKTRISYTVTVSNSSTPILNDDPILPMAFLSGGRYALPLVNAEDYSTGTKREVSATIRVTDAAGDLQLTDGIYEPSGDNGTTAVIRYLFKTDAGTLEKTFEIPIRSLKAEDGKLFDLKGLVVCTDSSVVTVEGSENYFVSATRDAQFFFAKPMLANGFRLGFNIGHRENGTFRGGAVQTVRLTLVDSQNRDQKIHVDISRRSDDPSSSLISVNGGTAYVLNGSFNGSTNYVFDINYNDETKTITDGSTLNVDVPTYADGQVFQGFESGEVYCMVDLIGVEESGVLMELLSLCGQPFNSGSIRDRIAPNMALTQALRVCYSYGEQALIPKVLVSDVLSTQSHMKVSVQSPAGEYVVASDGTKLEMVDSEDYRIALTQMGAYVVTFTIWDDNGAPASTVTRLLNVLDEQAPTLQAEKEELKTKVGTALNVNIFKATDNSGREPEIRLFIKNAAGKLIAVTEDTYTFEAAGKYYLVAIAYDAAGNLSRQDIPVTVGGA